MKIFIVILDVFAIIVCTIWLVRSNFDFEPIVVLLGLVAGMIVLNAKKEKSVDHEKYNNQIQKGGRQNVQIGGNFFNDGKTKS